MGKETETIEITMKYDDEEARDLILDEIMKSLKDGFSSGHKQIDTMDYEFESKCLSWYQK